MGAACGIGSRVWVRATASNDAPIKCNALRSAGYCLKSVQQGLCTAIEKVGKGLRKGPMLSLKLLGGP